MSPISPAFAGQLVAALRRSRALAIRLTRSPVDADDLVQEAALCAIRGWRSFEPDTNFGAWFKAIVRNCHFASYRQRQRRVQSVVFDDGTTLHAEHHLHEAGPWRATERRLEAEAVRAALATLPDTYRAVAVLFLVDDQSYQVIASTLEIPVGTVRSRLHRARRLLRERLGALAA